MRKTRRNSVSDDSTLHFKLTTFTFLFSKRADKRLITTLHLHTLSVHLELGGMQRLCHNLFTSRLLESLFCMHFSLYSVYSLLSESLLTCLPDTEPTDRCGSSCGGVWSARRGADTGTRQPRRSWASPA